MALFQFRWLRRFVRKHTNPIEVDRAEVWKRRFSVAYALIAWQAFGMVCYMIYTGRNDWAKYYGYKSEDEAALSPAQQFAKTMKIEKAKVIRFSGFHKVDESEINTVATESKFEK